MDWLLGPIVHVVDPRALSDHVLPTPVQAIATGAEYWAGDNNELQDEIAYDEERNAILVNHIRALVKEGHRVLALGWRIAQLEELEKVLGFGTVITGKTPKKLREKSISAARRGDVRALLATYQLAGEGLDIPVLSALVLLAPLGNSTKLIQASGRIARPHIAKLDPVVLDFVDQGAIVGALYRKRLRVYRGQGIEVQERGLE